MRRKLPIFYSALMLTGVNLLLRFIGTAFQVFISGQIGAEGVGLLQLVLSVGGMSLTAGIAGVRTATMYLVAEELGKNRKQNTPWILSGCMAYSIICSGAVALILYLLSPYLAENWISDPRSLEAIRLLAAFLPVSCLCGVFSGYFIAANRVGTLAAIEVAEQLLSMAVTASALVFWAHSDPGKACQAVVLGSSCGAVLTLISLSILCLRQSIRPGTKIPTTRRLLDTALPLALADDLKAGISTLENLMLPKRLALYTTAALALFGTVCGMVFPILMFPAAILFGLTELLIPEMARCRAAGSHGRIHYLMHRSLRLALIYGTLCSGVLFLSAPELCQALYQSRDAGTYLRWFAPLTVMLYCDIVTDAMIKGLGQQKVSVRYNILTSAMDVAFLFLLLPKFGIMGYFFSFLVTHALNFNLSLRRLIKITRQPIDLCSALLTLGCGLAGAGLCMEVPSPWLRCLAFGAVYFSALFLFRILGKEDIQWLKGLVYNK